MTFNTAYVLDISQTDGDLLPEFWRTKGDPGDEKGGQAYFLGP